MTTVWKIQEITNLFDDFAKEYDSSIDIDPDSYPSIKIIPEWIMNYLKSTNSSKEPKSILDIGCGTGKSSLAFFAFNEFELNVSGVDCSSNMLQIARSRPFKQLVLQNLEEMPWKVSDTFDAAICLGVIDFIQNPFEFFQQVYQKLRDDGVFCFTVPINHLPNETLLFSIAEIEKYLLQAGFVIVKKEEILGYKSRQFSSSIMYNAYFVIKTDRG